MCKTGNPKITIINNSHFSEKFCQLKMSVLFFKPGQRMSILFSYKVLLKDKSGCCLGGSRG
jgi:hypothetical protein